eukprot:156346-Amphidinium_carterae.1
MLSCGGYWVVLRSSKTTCTMDFFWLANQDHVPAQEGENFSQLQSQLRSQVRIPLTQRTETIPKE